MKPKIYTPKTMLEAMEPGKVFLVVKNDDGTFSPLLLPQSQATILHKLLTEFSSDQPFGIVHEKLKL